MRKRDKEGKKERRDDRGRWRSHVGPVIYRFEKENKIPFPWGAKKRKQNNLGWKSESGKYFFVRSYFPRLPLSLSQNRRRRKKKGRAIFSTTALRRKKERKKKGEQQKPSRSYQKAAFLPPRSEGKNEQGGDFSPRPAAVTFKWPHLRQ